MDDVLTDMLLAAEAGRARNGDRLRRRVRRGAHGDPARRRRGVALGVRSAADQAADRDMRARIPTTTLTRLCVALLDNAVQHAPRGSEVEISASAEGDRIAVRVIDAGSASPRRTSIASSSGSHGGRRPDGAGGSDGPRPRARGGDRRRGLDHRRAHLTRGHDVPSDASTRLTAAIAGPHAAGTMQSSTPFAKRRTPPSDETTSPDATGAP
jgi:hypothetical protein